MKYITAIICIAFALTANAQNTYDDAQLRYNLGLEKRLNKRWSLTLDQQGRFTKNMSEFNRASFDLGLAYKVNKHLKLKADYVFIERRSKAGYFTSRNWYYIGAVVKTDMDKFKFFYRHLIQARRGVFNDDENYITRFYSRSKVTIRHETTRRYIFYVAGEVYLPLNSPQTKGIERARGIAGVTIRTFKNQSLDLYFMYQHFFLRNKWYDQEFRFQNEFLERDFIYGISYNIAF